MMLAGSGKITGMWKVIFTNRVLPYFNAMGHHVRQPGAAAVNSLIVFSVNSSGITGIVRMVTEEKSRIYTKNQRESGKSEKGAGSGISMKNLYSEKKNSPCEESCKRSTGWMGQSASLITDVTLCRESMEVANQKITSRGVEISKSHKVYILLNANLR
jgi:hypothetical protein